MHQLSILVSKPHSLLASFEVLETSEKAGGTDMLIDDGRISIVTLNSPVSLKVMDCRNNETLENSKNVFFRILTLALRHVFLRGSSNSVIIHLRSRTLHT